MMLPKFVCEDAVELRVVGVTTLVILLLSALAVDDKLELMLLLSPDVIDVGDVDEVVVNTCWLLKVVCIVLRTTVLVAEVLLPDVKMDLELGVTETVGDTVISVRLGIMSEVEVEELMLSAVETAVTVLATV